MSDNLNVPGILRELNKPRPDYVNKPYELTDGAPVSEKEIADAKQQYVDDLLRAKHLDVEQERFLTAEILQALRQE